MPALKVLLRELNDTIHKKHLVWRLVQNKHTDIRDVSLLVAQLRKYGFEWKLFSETSHCWFKKNLQEEVHFRDLDLLQKPSLAPCL